MIAFSIRGSGCGTQDVPTILSGACIMGTRHRAALGGALVVLLALVAAGLNYLRTRHLGDTQAKYQGMKHLAGRAEEAAAVKAIEKLGGWVTVDPEQSGNPVVSVRLRFIEDMDARLEELKVFKGLQLLDLSGTQTTDDGLKKLAGLTSLQSLNLSRTPVKAAGLKELASLPSLDVLYLNKTQVTVDALKELAGSKSLQRLYLDDVQVSNRAADLKELASRPGRPEEAAAIQALEKLGGWAKVDTRRSGNPVWSSRSVTDAGLKEMKHFKSLLSLELGDSEVTDTGLKELAGLTSLQDLNLRDTRVTDAGLKELSGLKSLQSLNLSGTKVSDAALNELMGMKSLRMLHLGGTKVTGAGVRKLQKALPGCGMSHESFDYKPDGP